MPLSPNNPSAEKKLLRGHFRKRRAELTPERRDTMNRALLANMAAHPWFADADTLLLYYPIKGEPDLLPLARHALCLGKTVAFPLSDPETCTLTFHQISDPRELSVGAYGIPEPSPLAPMVMGTQRSLCIVPGLSFDCFGHRLGYGKGYYDRFLSRFAGKSVGLFYSDLLSDSLPHDENDRRVDLMITEKGELIPDETTS